MNIQDACAEKISVEKSYKKEESNVVSTVRLSEALTEFSKEYLSQAEEIEEKSIAYIEVYYDRLIEVLENVEFLKGAPGLRRLKEQRKRIRDRIAGGVKEPLAKRMSLDDTECLDILKMDAGSRKKNAMKAFTNKVIQEALDNVCRQVRNTLREQVEDIYEYLASVSEAREKEFGNLKGQYDRMFQMEVEEEKKKDEICMEALLILAEIEKVGHMLSDK